MKQRPQFSRGPSRISEHSPSVVVDAAAPNRGASIVRRASADHPSAFVSDNARRVRLPAAIAPVVRERYRARIDKFPRPSSRIERPIIRTSLQQQHRLLRMLRKQTRNRRPRGAATDNDSIGKLRKHHAHSRPILFSRHLLFFRRPYFRVTRQFEQPRISRDLLECLPPERQHFVELKTVDDNRSDLHFSTRSTIVQSTAYCWTPNLRATAH